MTKRVWIGMVAVAAMGAAMSVACSQNTVAALVETLGNACSAAAGLAGDATAAKQIVADTATASQQVLAWKSGTPTQDVEQALGDLEADLSAIPETSKVAPFIDLGIATIDGILVDITGQAPVANGSLSPTSAKGWQMWGSRPLLNGTQGSAGGRVVLVGGRRGVRHPKFAGKLPKRAGEFNSTWNALADKDASFKTLHDAGKGASAAPVVNGTVSKASFGGVAGLIAAIATAAAGIFGYFSKSGGSSAK